VSKLKFLFILTILNFVLFLSFFGFKIYFQPVAVVVPHHNVVAQKRLEYFYQIAQKRPFTKKIIIIGPDHFSPNQSGIIYSNRDWDLSSGSLKFNYSFESKLGPFLSLQNNIIKNDHAIYNLLPDLKTVWPNSQVFPILIGQNYPISKLDNLIQKINQICNFDCLLISSVDFSHYLPSALANIHDQKSIYDLSTQNLEEISKLEVDSPQSLYVLAKFSQLKNAQKWNLFYHSNSGEIVHDPDVETTSHVFGSYQKSLFKNDISSVKTYLITKNIGKKKSLSSLGPRFFYGTDFIDLNYSSKSSFRLPFDLPENTVVLSTMINNQPTFSFFPTETKNGATYFLRGDAKIKQLNSILKNINNVKI
jgi:poly-gamma-glutamate synthesis protein (capsule biosynthesis protein)